MINLSAMEQEIWKAVTGWEGEYKISNHGRVRSFDKMVKHGRWPVMRKKLGCILKTPPNANGYFHCKLNRFGKQKGYLLHRLIADAFIPNPENKETINHINGIKTDNRIENLEWATMQENLYHEGMVLKKGALHRKGERSYMSKLTNEIVLEIRRLFSEENKSQPEIAKIYKIRTNTVNRIINRKRWGHI